MANDDVAYVRNMNGVEVAPAGDAFVYFLPLQREGAFESLVVDGDDEAFDFLEDFSTRNIAVSRLLDIATLVEETLEAEGGGYSLANLALALKAAGFRDFTEQYADEITSLAGEGQS